jgi:signal transduction histidine kinase
VKSEEPDEVLAADSGRTSFASAAPDDLVVTANRLIQIGRFVPTFAHELNNCLQAIGGLAELVSEDAGLSAATADKLQRIVGQVDRGGAAIRLLLDFARGRNAAASRVDLMQLAQEVVALRRDTLTRLRIETGIERRSSAPVETIGSPRDLEGMLLALVLNAEDALRSAAGSRRLTLSVDADESGCTLAVEDSGVGVSDRVRAALFDPFVTALDRDDHAGFGLAAARVIAEGHGGTLRLEDSPGLTRFVVRLPRG